MEQAAGLSQAALESLEMVEEDYEIDENSTVNAGWSKENDAYFPIRGSHIVSRLAPGVYSLGMSMRSIFFNRMNIATDSLVLMDGGPAKIVIDEIRMFAKQKPEFVKRGFLHKRGIILHGAPGAGKSATLAISMKVAAKEMKAVCLTTDNVGLATMGLREMRKIEKDRLILCVMEDIDAIAERDEEALLNLMDGDAQIDNVIYIATSNHPDRLPPRLINRPSRFDTIVKVDMPSDALRRAFLESKEPTYSKEELDRIVKATKGYSIAHLKEFIILNKCFGHSIERAVMRVDSVRNGSLVGSDEEKTTKKVKVRNA